MDILTIQVHAKQQKNATALKCALNGYAMMEFEKEYLPGAGAAEMGNASAGYQALLAQIIAIRTLVHTNAILGNGTISDKGNEGVAFDAVKRDSPAYARVHQAVKDTAGIILTYNGRFCKTHFSSSNGGETVDAFEYWGKEKIPYEIRQPDPWDAAVGKARTRPGVGMSQTGAQYAASIGKTYAEILAFYYPGTVLQGDYGKSEVITMTQVDKIEKAVAWTRKRVDDPYVFATSGQKCTPALRRERAAAKPAYAENIYKYCPVLSNKQSTCSGCKYEGKPAHDCRGLTYELAEELGIDMTSFGATAQRNDDCWAVSGLIGNVPTGMLCILFRQNQDNPASMKHTGILLPDGTVVDARGHANGVVAQSIASFPWTHYNIWKGLYDAVELPEGDFIIEPADSGTKLPTLRKGSKGSRVAEIQGYLMSLWYDLGSWGADGDFGDKTKEAVEKFQKDHGLVIDGVCGPMTWAALLLKAGNTEVDEESEPPTSIILWVATVPDLIELQVDQLKDTYPGTTAVQQG